MLMFILRTARSAASLLSLSLSLALAVVVATPRPARAATTTGQVRGRVTGPDGKPLGGVTVVLANEITGHRQEATTGSDGTYLLYNVPPNPYHLTIEVQGFQPYHADVDVRGSAPVVKNIALAVMVTATEAVHAEAEGVELESDTSMTHVDIDKSLIRRRPPRCRSAGLRVHRDCRRRASRQDENGRYHFQGGHSQQLLVIDGQPIGDQIGMTFSNSLDPGDRGRRSRSSRAASRRNTERRRTASST